MSAISKISLSIVLLCLVLLAIYTLRPPGKTPIPQEEQAALTPEVWIDSGELPGITWADDTPREKYIQISIEPDTVKKITMTL